MALRRTRRVDGVRVDGPSARRRPGAAHRKDVDQSCPRDPPGSARAALGVRVRRHAVDASTGVPRPRPTGGGRVPATCSKFHPYSRNPAPTRSASAQNRKRNHPLPSFLETSRVDGVQRDAALGPASKSLCCFSKRCAAFTLFSCVARAFMASLVLSRHSLISSLPREMASSRAFTWSSPLVSRASSCSCCSC